MQVVPSELGQTLPFYFPFSPSYWKSSRRSTWKAPGSPESHPLRSAASEECDVAVSIQDLSKVYSSFGGEDKLALDSLSLDIYQGQITALLGERSTFLVSRGSIVVLVYMHCFGAANPYPGGCPKDRL